MLKTRYWLILLAVCFLLGAGVGSYITYQHFPRTIEKRVDIEKPVVKEVVKVETETQIQYVARAIDPVTGQKENTDLEANINQPKIGVKVNGKDHEFGLLQGETQKFENGKIVMNQDSTIKFEVEVPTVHQKWRVGAYADWTVGDNHPSAGARVNRQFKHWDGDVYINQDKDVKGQITVWF